MPIPTSGDVCRHFFSQYFSEDGSQQPEFALGPEIGRAARKRHLGSLQSYSGGTSRHTKVWMYHSGDTSVSGGCHRLDIAWRRCHSARCISDIVLPCSSRRGRL